MSRPALLVLADGTVFDGVAVGSDGAAVGEVVFNTAMTGYQEILTDPSYARQIVTLTMPHIGNTGANDEDVESTSVFASGLVVRDVPARHSNFRATGSLGDWLQARGVVAISDVDTRALTRHLRENGAQGGCIVAGFSYGRDAAVAEALEAAKTFPGLAGMDLAREVSCSSAYSWSEGVWRLAAGSGAGNGVSSGAEAGGAEAGGAEAGGAEAGGAEAGGAEAGGVSGEAVGQGGSAREAAGGSTGVPAGAARSGPAQGDQARGSRVLDGQTHGGQTQSAQPQGAQPQTGPHVVAMDFGVKHNILRLLVERGCRVTVVPATTDADTIRQHSPDGLFLSNGPGDPEPCNYAIETIRALLAEDRLPTFGICLGHQLLALASGARTMKMKFGHHGANHPVLDITTGRVMISSQNHGFAVDADTLGNDIAITHTSLFDGTLQGIRRLDVPAFGFQGHPEASPGPHDVTALFDRFVASMQG